MAATNQSAASVRRCRAWLLGAMSTVLAFAAVRESAGAAPAAAEGPLEIQGFSPSGAAAEAELERRFDAGLSAAQLRSWMEEMASEPNHVGSAHDRANAEFQLKKFREWGWDAAKIGRAHV